MCAVCTSQIQCYKTSCTLAQKKERKKVAVASCDHVSKKKNNNNNDDDEGRRTEGLDIMRRESSGQPAGVTSSDSSCSPFLNNIYSHA